MNPEAAQQPRNVSEEEIKIIQDTFTEDVLKAMRALMFGLNVIDSDKGLVRAAFSNSVVRKIVWRRFYPQLDKETPIGQVQDAWLGAEQMISGYSPEVIAQAIAYKERALDMTKRGLELIDDPDGEQISLAFNPGLGNADPMGVELLARNQYIKHVESQLLFLHIIASMKKDPEEKDEDGNVINKNSSK